MLNALSGSSTFARRRLVPLAACAGLVGGGCFTDNPPAADGDAPGTTGDGAGTTAPTGTPGTTNVDDSSGDGTATTSTTGDGSTASDSTSDTGAETWGLSRSWLRVIGGDLGDDRIDALRITDAGRVYAVGAVNRGMGAGADVYVAVLDDLGELIESYEEYDHAGLWDEARGVALWPGGVIVSGVQRVDRDPGDGLLRVWNDDGTSEPFAMPPSGDGLQILRDVVVTATAVYATGSVSSENGDDDIYVASWALDGELNWEDIYDWQGEDDRAGNLAITSEGGVVVTGTVTDALLDTQLFVRRYIPQGSISWTEIDGDPMWKEAGAEVAADGAGNVYVAGSREVEGEGFNPFVRRLGAAGGEAWTQAQDYAGLDDRGTGVAVHLGPEPWVAACGRVSTPDTGTAVWLAIYELDGTLLGSAVDEDLNAFDDTALACASTADGDLVVGGRITNEDGDRDGFVARYQTDAR